MPFRRVHVRPEGPCKGRGRPLVTKATDLPPPAERRPSPRRRVLLGGLVAYSDGERSFDCIIRNLSDTGARITLPPSQPVPSNIYLINVRDRTAHEAKIMWNDGFEAGVAFLKSFPITDLPDPKLAYLKRLWSASAVR